MSLSRCSKPNKGMVGSLRTLLLCIFVSVAVTVIIICVISLVFAMLESISKNAAAPLAVAAGAIGCFAGSYFCAGVIHDKCIIVGAVIGFLHFLIIFLLSCFYPGFCIGSGAAIKLFVFIVSGCCGGYCGGNRRCCGKRRK